MKRGLPKHAGQAFNRAMNSAICFRSGGESQGVSLHGWASRLPRQMSITNPFSHRSFPIWLFHGQSDNHTPSESLPNGGMLMTFWECHCAWSSHWVTLSRA